MFISVLGRRLKPGKTYKDFLDAWYPDTGFGFPGRGPILARNVADDGELDDASVAKDRPATRC
jgi:hypothetical protein